MKKARKNKKFIIYLVMCIILGFVAGILRVKKQSFNINTHKIIQIYLPFGFLAISLIITILQMLYTFDVKSKIKNINLDDIPDKFDSDLGNFMMLGSLGIIISLMWFTIMMNKMFDNNKLRWISYGFLIISIIFQNISQKLFNRTYPNKKINIFEDNASEKYFNKLDEGERWIVYNSAYSTFLKMQIVYGILLGVTLLISFATSIPIIVPLIIGFIWIIETSIYFLEAKKYE